MSGARGPRVLTIMASLTIVVSIIGVITTLILNAFVFDEYDAYGEVPIPGATSVHLPEGDVDISFTSVVIGSSNGGLPVPQLSINIVAPEGVPDPTLTEDIGSTTTVNNNARVRVWVAKIHGEGTYDITTDGNVGPFLAPTLAFGHGTKYWWVTLLFAGLLVLAIVDLIIARIWAAKVGKRAGPPIGYYGPAPSFGAPSSFGGGVPTYVPPTAASGVGYIPPTVQDQPTGSYTPTDQAIRVEQLNTIARLRDSGALTQDEFEAEKKRILEGH